MEIRKKSATTWIVVAIVLVGLCACAAVAVAVAAAVPVSWAASEQSETEWERVAVEGPVALVVDDLVGDVNIQAGQDGELTVAATKKVRALSRRDRQQLMAEVQVRVTQQGNQVLVQVETPAWGRGWPEKRSARVNLEIRVPRQTSVTLRTEVGAVRLQGLEGEFDVSSGVGDLDLVDVVAVGKLAARSGVGDVTFRGALPADGEFELGTDVGRVSARVPEGASFYVDARTEVGQIRCRVDGAEQREAVDRVGESFQGTIGAAPRGRLYLHTDVGDITVEH